MKTLWDTFFDANDEACRIPWKIYGSKSHKLLCEDYRRLPEVPENTWFDFLEVVSIHRTETYWKVYVKEITPPQQGGVGERG